MERRIAGVLLLGLAIGFVGSACLVAQPQETRTVRAGDLPRAAVLTGAEIPDSILLPGGAEVPLLLSAKNVSEIVKWAGKQCGLISIRENGVEADEVVVAIDLGLENGLWVLLDYTGPRQWRLAAVAAVLSGKNKLSCVDYYRYGDSLVAVSDAGELVARITVGRQPPDKLSPSRQPAGQIEPNRGKCEYRYPNLPSFLSIGPFRQPVLRSADSRDQIVSWSLSNSPHITCLRSVGHDRLVVSDNIAFGIAAYSLQVYVRAADSGHENEPWKLACVGSVSTAESRELSVMYVDASTSELVLLDAYGNKIGVLQMTANECRDLPDDE